MKKLLFAISIPIVMLLLTISLVASVIAAIAMHLSAIALWLFTAMDLKDWDYATAFEASVHAASSLGPKLEE